MRLRAAVKHPFEFCAHCAAPLFLAAEQDRRLIVKANSHQMSVTRQVGEMLTLLPSLAVEEVHEPDLRQVIDSCIARGLGGTSELVRTTGISKAALSNLLNGGRAGLHTWIRIAVGANVSLAGLFVSNLWREDVHAQRIQWQSAQLATSSYQQVDWKEMRETAKTLIASGASRGVYQFCRDQGIDPTHAKKMLGALSTQLNAVAARRLRAEKAHAVEKLTQQIIDMAEQFRSSGLRISARSIAKRLRVSRQSSNFELSYARASEKLGIAKFSGRRRTVARHAQRQPLPDA